MSGSQSGQLIIVLHRRFSLSKKDLTQASTRYIPALASWDWNTEPWLNRGLSPWLLHGQCAEGRVLKVAHAPALTFLTTFLNPAPRASDVGEGVAKFVKLCASVDPFKCDATRPEDKAGIFAEVGRLAGWDLQGRK